MSIVSESARERFCKRLRWKGMFVDVPRDPTMPSGSESFCWCTHTMTCLGPDGKVAAKDSCKPDRDCHEAL